jgi:hypothetical protein
MTNRDDELEDDWKDLRPDPILPPPGARMQPDDIQNIARALTGKKDPKVPELHPDRLLHETTLRSGLIVPAFPEFVGRFPPRQEVSVLGSDTPRETIGWTLHEMTDEEIEEENSPENLQRLHEERMAISPEVESFFSHHRVNFPVEPPEGYEGAYRWPMSMGYTSIPVLQGLWGTPWCNAAANFLPALRPSCVRVTRGEVTLDAVSWRVTVYLNADDTISRIEQEVEVGLVGFRNGQDASNYLEGRHRALEAPQANMIFNPRALRAMELLGDDEGAAFLDE